jgi:hypothetical protein
MGDGPSAFGAAWDCIPDRAGNMQENGDNSKKPRLAVGKGGQQTRSLQNFAGS